MNPPYAPEDCGEKINEREYTFFWMSTFFTFTQEFENRITDFWWWFLIDCTDSLNSFSAGGNLSFDSSKALYSTCIYEYIKTCCGRFNRYGDQDSVYHSCQRDGFFNSGYSGRGPKGGDGHRGRQNRGGFDRWGNPYWKWKSGPRFRQLYLVSIFSLIIFFYIRKKFCKNPGIFCCK